MKTLKYFAVLAAAFMTICATSCGSKKDNDAFMVTVDNTFIGGKLSEYFSLADKTFKYKKGIIDEVAVELNCIMPLPENMKACIGLDVLDKDGIVISICEPSAWSFNDYKVLQQATTGQIVTILIKNHQGVEKEKPAKIRLSSIVEEEVAEIVSNSYASKAESTEDDDEAFKEDDEDEEIETIPEDDDDDFDDDDDTDSHSSSSSSSKDWNEILDSYQQFVDKFILLEKKVTNGDLSAYTEYLSVMEKALEVNEKMENVESEMSASQWARYMKITDKLTKAMTNAADNM